jgi:hypothetical protein
MNTKKNQKSICPQFYICYIWLLLLLYACSTPSQPGTYNLQCIVTCQLNALSLPIISTNVINSNQTCTRARDELGRHVSQSNKEKIMMGQYIHLYLASSTSYYAILLDSSIETLQCSELEKSYVYLATQQ